MELKALHHEGVPHALEKAERYRLLNEPAEAESICRDILTIEPENQRALICLLLALTDQIGHVRQRVAGEAREVIKRLSGAYEREYYSGVLEERIGKARLRSGGPGSGFVAYEHLQRAMERFDEAERLSPPDNDDAKLRWNSCARMLAAHPELRPAPEEDRIPLTLE